MVRSEESIHRPMRGVRYRRLASGLGPHYKDSPWSCLHVSIIAFRGERRLNTRVALERLLEIDAVQSGAFPVGIIARLPELDWPIPSCRSERSMGA
jgi:hypothetical protein